MTSAQPPHRQIRVSQKAPYGLPHGYHGLAAGVPPGISFIRAPTTLPFWQSSESARKMPYMPDLIVQGSQPQFRWRRTLLPDQPIVLGRTCGNWSIPWDPQISRQHATVRWTEGSLEVQQRDEASNPVYFNGRPRSRFSLRPNQHFVIGDTTFTLVDAKVRVAVQVPRPDDQQTFTTDFLQSIQFRHADQRIDVLSRLPGIIARANNDHELFVQLVNLLLGGVPRADAAALVRLRGGHTPDGNVEVLHWDHRDTSTAAFTPSAGLIREALQQSQSIVHVWNGPTKQTGFTQSESFDWAFCIPLVGASCRNWAFYLAGSMDSTAAPTAQTPPHEFQDDVKFTELAASTLSNLREVRRSERLNQFFSPAVIDVLAGQDPDDILAPREVDVSVLFCDLRGFARHSEQESDNLLGLLHRVSDALGVMTGEILQQGGVIGDFHGDAAMGFWGWPLEQPDSAQRACRAALAIQQNFAAAAQDDRQHALSGFRVGIGIASGRAVAGKIGTVDQVKVTVFGPVVNLASRLETLTKNLRTPVLIDEQTAQSIRSTAATGGIRLRRVARVCPAGLTTPLDVCELLPSGNEFPELTDEHIACYETALNAFEEGEWTRAIELLHHLPATDQVKDFLTVYIAQHNRTPPAGWDRVIRL